MSAVTDITGVILAGGEGRRMHGQDKGWIELNGLPLIQQVLNRLQPQVKSIVISANRNIPEYQALCDRIITDDMPFLGPLSGIASALEAIDTQYAVIVPTDAPLVPKDLVQSLQTKLPAKLILCKDDERLQPLFGLYHRDLAVSIRQYLSSGERKLTQWCMAQNPEIVSLDDHRSFTNINTPLDLERFEKNPNF